MPLKIPAIILLLLATQVYGVIIDPSRRVDWTGNAGIPGGMPQRNTIHISFTHGVNGFSTNGTSDMRALIQTAIGSCPVGQVVKLPAGPIKLNSGLLMKSGITLRGAGMNSTALKGTVSGADEFGPNGGIITFYEAISTSNSRTNPITAGATKGSTNITVSGDTSYLHGGNIMFIDRLDDGVFIDGYGSASGSTPRSDNDSRGNAAHGGGYRHNSQEVEILTVAGAAITFRPPLVYTFSNSPCVFYKVNTTKQTNHVSWAGVEDMTINNVNPTTSGFQNILLYKNAAYCWAKNVMTTDAAYGHVGIYNGYKMEFRGCTFSNMVVFTASGGYGFRVGGQTCSSLIEDNIFIKTRDFVRVDAGSSGNVVIYNYHTNAIPATGSSDPQNTGIAHNAHPMMNLFEGNITYTPRCDYTWGSSSHGTLLRNWFRGPMPWAEQNGWAIELRYRQTYYNLVGNILGSEFQRTNPEWSSVKSLHVKTNGVSFGGYSTFLIGSTNNGMGGSLGNQWAQWTNTIAAGNFDYIAGASGQTNWYTNGVVGAVPETIPDSYYYVDKPAYFGNMTWPPFSPYPLTVGETNIPAGWRYRFGTNPAPNGILAPSNLQLSFGATNISPRNILDFTPIPVTNTVSFSNIGNASLEFSFVTGPATFQVLNSSPITLSPGASTNLFFKYTPPSIFLGPLTPQSATLIFTNGGGANVRYWAAASYPAETQSILAGDSPSENDFSIVNSNLVASYDKMSLYPGKNGEAYFTFSLATNSIVYFTASVNATNLDDNSFFWAVNSSPTSNGDIWDITKTGTGPGLVTVTVDRRGAGPKKRPDEPAKSFYLLKGNHYIKVVGRKANTKLASITANVRPVMPQIQTLGRTDTGVGVSFQR